MSKQDRLAPRTAAQLEQKYSWGKRFLEILGIANDAQDVANNAKATANQAAAAVNDIKNGLTPEAVFNLLTNNGEAQGIFRGEDGQIYINASYIAAGLLSADYIKANVPDGATGYDSWEELNAMIEAEADAMPLNTVRFISCIFEAENAYGATLIRISTGYNADGFKAANVTMVVGGHTFTREGFSEGLDDEPMEWEDWVDTSTKILGKTVSWKDNGDGTFTLIGI